MTNLEKLQDNLERLESHLESIKNGSLTAKDDLATTLHLLVGSGQGYGLIYRTLTELKLEEPLLAGYQNYHIVSTAGNKNIALAIRAVNFDNDFKLPLSKLLQQEVIYHDSSTWSTLPSLTWKDIISKSRNKFGSHVDEKPPKWLETLRYYPAASADVITLLLWSFGEELLRSITDHLDNNGIDIVVYEPCFSLNGISFQSGELVANASEKFEVAAAIKVTEEYRGNRTILGGIYITRPFILGLNPNRQIVLSVGAPNSSLDNLENEFILGPDALHMNRASRRAARKKNSKH